MSRVLGCLLGGAVGDLYLAEPELAAAKPATTISGEPTQFSMPLSIESSDRSS